MTVAELLRDKFADECEDGLLLIYTDGNRSYASDFRDDYAAHTYGDRDVASYHYSINADYEEPDELEIILK